MLLGLPAMVGIGVMREPILRVLFMRGEFGLHEVAMSSASLLASTTGLLSLMLIQGIGARLLRPSGYQNAGADRGDVDGRQHGVQPHFHLSARLCGVGALDRLLGHSECGIAVQGVVPAERLSSLPPYWACSASSCWLPAC